MKSIELIRPAFTQQRTRFAFAAILAFFLLLPAILYLFNVPSMQQVYKGVHRGFGPFAFFHDETFLDKRDIDILFIGPSLTWSDIDARMVKDELSKRLKREAIVLNFSTNWRGEDVYYMLFKEVSARRKIKLLVVNPPQSFHRDNDPHAKAHYWMLFGRDWEGLRGLSFYRQAQLYAFNVLGAPRHLLGLLRPHMPNTEGGQDFGSEKREAGYIGEKFVPFKIDPPVFRPDQLIESLNSPNQFRVTGPPLGDYQAHFVRKLFNLARERNVPVATLYLPIYDSRNLTIVDQREQWSRFSHANVESIGIANSQLFKGLTEDEILKLYYDSHLNANGAEYFTKAILPALFELYSKHAQKEDYK